MQQKLPRNRTAEIKILEHKFAFIISSCINKYQEKNCFGCFGVLDGVLLFLVGVLGVGFGILYVFGIGMVYLLRLVFGMLSLAVSSKKGLCIFFRNSELTLQKAVYFHILYAKKYAGLKKVHHRRWWWW